jgi:hypothetical protein
MSAQKERYSSTVISSYKGLFSVKKPILFLDLGQIPMESSILIFPFVGGNTPAIIRSVVVFLLHLGQVALFLLF